MARNSIAKMFHWIYGTQDKVKVKPVFNGFHGPHARHKSLALQCRVSWEKLLSTPEKGESKSEEDKERTFHSGPIKTLALLSLLGICIWIFFFFFGLRSTKFSDIIILRHCWINHLICSTSQSLEETPSTFRAFKNVELYLRKMC